MVVGEVRDGEWFIVVGGEVDGGLRCLWWWVGFDVCRWG